MTAKSDTEPPGTGDQASGIPANAKAIWDQRWAREPQQDRSSRTRDAQLDAAQTLLETEGLDGVTIAKVAKLAGVSVGTPYHYFQDKTALIYAVVDRHTTKAAEVAEVALDPRHWQDATVMDILEAYLRQAIELGRAFNGTHRALRRLALEDAHIAEHTAEAHRAIHRPVVALLRASAADAPDAPDPVSENALAVILDVLWSCIDQRLSHLAPGTSEVMTRLTDDQFIAELIVLAKTYLQIP